MKKEDINFLKELQHEMKTQDTDCEAAPRFWVIGDYRWVVVPSNDYSYDRVSLSSPNSCTLQPIENYIEDVLTLKSDIKPSEDELKKLQDIIYNKNGCFDYDNILNWIQHYDDGSYELVYENNEFFIVPNTLFITKQECKEHIKLNAHHYTNEAHSYAMTAWRSPKIEKLFKILEDTNWDSFLEEDSLIKQRLQLVCYNDVKYAIGIETPLIDIEGNKLFTGDVIKWDIQSEAALTKNVRDKWDNDLDLTTIVCTQKGDIMDLWGTTQLDINRLKIKKIKSYKELKEGDTYGMRVTSTPNIKVKKIEK